MTTIETLLTKFGPGAICVMSNGGSDTFETFATLADGRPVILLNGDGLSYGLDGKRLGAKDPAEIMALVAAEQRKRDRLMLAGQFMASDIARGDVCSPATYVKAADALLAELDKEGVE